MEPSDRELVDRIRAGDSEAFGELLRRYGPRIFSYLVHRLGDRTEAEDAYAEAMMRMWKGISRYQERGRLSAWLFTIAHRLSTDRLETRGRRRTQPLEDSAGASLADRLAAPEPGPEREAESRHARRRIEKALACLPEDQRQVFLLREYGGLTFSEIADAMDCPLGTALARMRYAVLKLRKELEDLHA